MCWLGARGLSGTSAPDRAGLTQNPLRRHLGIRLGARKADADEGVFVSFTWQPGYDALADLQAASRVRDLDPREREFLRTCEHYVSQKLTVYIALRDSGVNARLAIGTDAGPFDVGFGRFHPVLEPPPGRTGRTRADAGARRIGVTGAACLQTMTPWLPLWRIAHQPTKVVAGSWQLGRQVPDSQIHALGPSRRRR
jgi:hypothetical protein